MPWIRPASFADALTLADRLRYEDAREIAACWGLGAREGLFHCLMHSERQFVLFEGAEPVALWGISGMVDAGLRIGVPWMLATDRLFDGRRERLQRSRRIVDHLLHDHDVLTNLTDADNTAHLRWLAWCGFRELRRHERHGHAASPFVEFYQSNPGRGLADEVVRSVLLHRTVGGRPPQNEVVNRLVRAGIAVLDRPAQVDEQHLEALAAVLEQLDDAASVYGRLRQGCIRLLLEVAVAIANGPGASGPFRHQPVRELMAGLARVADLLVLEGLPLDGGVVDAVDPSRPVAQGRRADARPPDEPVGGGAGGFAWLLRRYVRMLTLDGRLSRLQGYRLWQAAVGADRQQAAAPLGIPRRRLGELLADHRLSRTLLPAAGSGALTGGPVRLDFDAPVERGRALAAMRAACRPGSRLHDAVATQLDELVLQTSLPQGRLSNLGELVFIASAVADRAALQLLPRLRLGGVVSGYADRQVLYRLLRARLVVEGSGLPAGAVVPLLLDEVIALLAAGSIERCLLSGRGVPTAEEIVTALRAADREIALQPGRTGSARPGAWLVPALAVPVRHEIELEPALLAWHLAACGDLPRCLQRLGDLLVEVRGDDPPGPRLRYRKFLRRLARDIDIVTLASHLGMPVDAEPAEARRREPARRR